MDARTLVDLMLEQAKDYALILLDADGKVIAWLMGSAYIFGHEANAMNGRTIHCLFTHEDQAAGVPESELENARRASAGEDDRWMVRADGGRFWASGFVFCMREPASGDVVGYAKLVRDRTDQRAQVETFRNRADQLAAEDQRKTMLFGTLAHELRNPLGAVANATDLIDYAYPADPKLAYALQILKRQTKYVSSLIEDLLEVARAQAGKTVLQYSEIDLGSLIRDVLETLGSRIADKEQRMEFLQPPSPIQVEGDATRLKQVFLNLIQNASKFSDRGTPIIVKCTIEGDEAVVRVEDYGQGISPALLPRVFDLLSQADVANPEGLGLGLSLVKQYVELHGGTVQVRSEGIGRGSEFDVRLPVRRRLPRPIGT